MVEILRIEKSPGECRGVLRSGGEIICLTLEPGYGVAEHPCIPEGRYVCVRVVSPKFGDTFMVTGVDGRSKILFHHGNTAKDTEGCILLGDRFGEREGRKAVLDSMVARGRFMRVMGDTQTFELGVKAC